MRNFVKNAVIKKVLIVLITIIMISNFIMPNKVYAGELEDVANGFFYLLAKLGDVGIKMMQDLMLGDDEIQNGDNFEIKYSPGMIFSGKVLALDVNFLDPNPEKKDAKKTETVEEAVIDKIVGSDTWDKHEEMLNKYGYNDEGTTDKDYSSASSSPSATYPHYATYDYFSWTKADGKKYRAVIRRKSFANRIRR